MDNLNYSILEENIKTLVSDIKHLIMKYYLIYN